MILPLAFQLMLARLILLLASGWASHPWFIDVIKGHWIWGWGETDFGGPGLEFCRTMSFPSSTSKHRGKKVLRQWQLGEAAVRPKRLMRMTGWAGRMWASCEASTDVVIGLKHMGSSKAKGPLTRFSCFHLVSLRQCLGVVPKDVAKRPLRRSEVPTR